VCTWSMPPLPGAQLEDAKEDARIERERRELALRFENERRREAGLPPLQRTRRVPHPVPRRPSPTAAPHHRDRPLRGSRPHPPTVKGPQASAPGAVRGPWRTHGGVPGPGCLVAERRTRPGRGLLRGPVAAAAGGRGLQGWGLAAPAAGPLWVGVPRAGRTGVEVAAVLVGVVEEAEAALGGTGGLEAGLGVIGARGFPLWRQCSGRRSACCAWTRRRRQGS
jgi:hypothetical protein